jgi:hypothetical protein
MPWRRKPANYLEYWSGPVNRKTGGGMDDPGKALLQSAGVSHTLFRQTEDRNR